MLCPALNSVAVRLVVAFFSNSLVGPVAGWLAFTGAGRDGLCTRSAGEERDGEPVLFFSTLLILLTVCTMGMS